MRHPVGGDRHETLEEQQRLQRRVAGRIALDDRAEVAGRAGNQSRLLGENPLEQRAQLVPRHVLPGQLAGQPGAQRPTQRGLADHHVIQQRPQPVFLFDHRRRPRADHRPHRVDVHPR